MIRRLRFLPAAVGIVLATLPLPASQADADPAVVRLQDGVLRGVTGTSTITFQGIPYAAPPVGNLRWTPPRRPVPWSGIRDAGKPTPYCPQPGGDGQPMPNTSEDCLYLHVTVPKAKPKGPRPVMVWSHGGGFSSGSGSQHVPTSLVTEGDVIVVTVDFRIGIFGNFGLAGLPGSGTFGLQDQQAALRWVRDNIGAFGGDAHSVTLFGESGGGIGTCGLLTSPGTRGLVDRAIMQSGSCLLDWPANGLGMGIPAGSFWQPTATIQQNGRAAATRLGCKTLSCLRKLDTSKVFAESALFGSVAYGNPTLPLEPGKALRAGLVPRIPILSGHTKDEARAIAAIAELLSNPVTAANYPTRLQEAFGARAREVEAVYPAKTYGTAALAWSAMDTDRVWSCTQRATTKAFARTGDAYAYEFADPAAPGYVPFPPGFPTGASHGSELNYLFDAAGGPAYQLTPAQQKLAVRMRKAWTDFARTGNPGWAHWPNIQQLAPVAVQPADHHCAFWSTFK
ncbi:carboxylesterase/lipase family protein [Kribbella sp. NPDC051587]|uniref:carboxylesterase/lipase family protein n=1 Tax=Kribbella sp. NPDC051587 TaxID=3364119 RepID=UPI00378F4EBC